MIITLQKSKQYVSSNSAFMGFIQHNNRVGAAERVYQTLSLQHAIRHVFNSSFWTCAVLKTNRISNFLAKTTTDLFGYTLRNRHGCNPSRLRTAYSTPVSITRFS